MYLNVVTAKNVDNRTLSNNGDNDDNIEMNKYENNNNNNM